MGARMTRWGLVLSLVVAAGCGDDAAKMPGGTAGVAAGTGAGVGAAGTDGAAGSAGTGAGVGAAGTAGAADGGMDAGGIDKYELAAQNPLSTPLLIVLIDFADTNMMDRIADPENDWAGLIFGTDENEGNHYWYEASTGTFQLLPATESSGTPNNGVMHVKLTSMAPTGTTRLVVEDQTWIPEALTQAEQVVDFAAYDDNADGKLQNTELAVMFALNVSGTQLMYANAQANVIFDYMLPSDGVVLEKFLRVLWFYTSIGVNMHELGHHLFNMDHHPAPSEHSLMGTGAYGDAPGKNGLYDLLLDGTRPTHPLGYQKAMAGFITPTTITQSMTGVQLRSASTGDYNLVRLPLASGALYLENRTAEGYDASIPFCNGHTGGLFATEVAERVVPFDAVNYLTGRTTATYDMSLARDFCQHYSLAGVNDSFQLGQYTISNVSAAGPTMTFDVAVSAAAPQIDHYKLRYAIPGGPNSSILWHHVHFPENGMLELDYQSLSGGDDAAGYQTIELSAYYDTGEMRIMNEPAVFTSDNAYVDVIKSYAGESLDMPRQGIIYLRLNQAQPYVSTANVQVVSGAFTGTLRLTNLPMF
jgi:M6 family metalloprotease-like protein